MASHRRRSFAGDNRQSTLPFEPSTTPAPIEPERRRAAAWLKVLAILVALGCAWLSLHALFRLLHD